MEVKPHDSVSALLKDVTIPTVEQAPQQAEKPAAPVPELITPAATVEKEKPAAIEAVKPELDMSVVSNSADIAIGLFDFSQTSIFSMLCRKKKKRVLTDRFGLDAVEKSENLKNEIEANQENTVKQTVLREFSADEFGMLRIERNAAEYINDLPLSDDEKSVLKAPLIEIMKKRGGSIPPEIALLLGILQISGARSAELYML